MPDNRLSTLLNQPRRNMTPEEWSALQSQGGLEPTFPLDPTDLVPNFPLFEYLGEIMGAAGEKTKQGAEYLGVPPKYASAAAFLPMVAATLLGHVPGKKKLPGAFAPPEGHVPGNVRAAMKAEQAALPAKIQEKAAQFAKSNPEFRAALPYLQGHEVTQLVSNKNNIEAFERMARAIPSAAKVAAAAKMGEHKRGWYRASTEALIEVFGKEDAPRFAALLAATSPQTSVESNLQNALNIWKNWSAAGKPTDPDSIRAVMAASVQGGKGDKSILGAWFPNTVTALQAPDPRKIDLSGFKVDSFYRNLADDVFRVTSDTWQANAMRVAQDNFNSPGGYFSVGARTREAGHRIGFDPREVQESVWSLVKPWSEQSSKQGIHPREFLQRGLLTPELIRGTPDFSTLLKDPAYARILDQAGYGDQLSQMRSYQWPTVTPELSLAEQRHLEGIGDYLHQLNIERGRETRSRAFSPGYSRPDSVLASGALEAIPGEDTRHLPGLLNAPWDAKKRYTTKFGAALRDERGHNIMSGSLGLPTMEQRAGVGLWDPGAGRPITTNPLIVIPQELPLTGGTQPARLYGSDAAKMDAAAAFHGLLGVQAGSPYVAMVRNETGAGMQVPLTDKLTRENIVNAGGLKQPDIAIADLGEGSGAAVFPFSGRSMDQAEKATLADALRAGDPIENRKMRPPKGSPKGTPKVPVPSYGSANNVGDYIDFSEEFKQPEGTGAATGKFFSYMDPAKVGQRAYDAASDKSSQIAGDVLDLTESSIPKYGPAREDVLNMYRILKAGGIKGLKQALASGAYLPGVAAMALLPQLLEQFREDERTPQAVY